MSRPLPWFWIAVAAVLLLLPMPVGRLLLDVLGGLTLTLLLLPLLAGAAVWIGWQVLRSRLRPCPVCGFSSIGMSTCPACGASMLTDVSQAAGSQAAGGAGSVTELDASQVTINIQAVEVELADPGADSSPSQN